MCSYLEDTLGIAAIYQCLCRMIWRLRSENKRWRDYPRMLIAENRWRAQRYGLDEGLVDFGKGSIVPCGDLLEEIIGLVGKDSDVLGCRAEIEATRQILTRGTSAHRQIALYDNAVANGATREEALRSVVDGLIAETAHGLT
jgi:carboxylate-amine ligase